ncbi:GNAT family N-acetyltransferase [Streptomyces sp. NPDC057456]|uniref:GNAT family N-acetyltransferase n=1 Tax=Streptomyces sp. NPDC057456 TaxID=3346139 RepID=UPI0036777120
MDRFVQAWVDGWVVSRGAAPPVAEPWGWTVDVGTGTRHVTRHVLGATNEAVTEPTVRKAAGAVTGAGVWLKVFADPAVVGPWLGPHWRIDPEPGFLMTAPLADVPPGAAPDGYRTRTWSRGGVTRTMIAAPDGSLAARGQIAPTGATAVVDQIETSPGHRRRGLGALVMRTLHRAAVAQGARTGVLGATPQGRALYESLGWRVESSLTSAEFTGDTRG